MGHFLENGAFFENGAFLFENGAFCLKIWHLLENRAFFENGAFFWEWSIFFNWDFFSLNFFDQNFFHSFQHQRISDTTLGSRDRGGVTLSVTTHGGAEKEEGQG